MNKRIKKKKTPGAKFKIRVILGDWDVTFDMSPNLSSENISIEVHGSEYPSPHIVNEHHKLKVINKCTFFSSIPALSAVTMFIGPYWSLLSTVNDYQIAVEKFLGDSIDNKLSQLKSGEILSWYRSESSYKREYIILNYPCTGSKWHKIEFIKL